MTGARYEVAVDGKPRSYWSRKPIATGAAERLKRKNPDSTVKVRDVENGETETIKDQMRSEAQR